MTIRPGAVGDCGRARYDKVSANLKSRGLLPSRFACHLPPGGRLYYRLTVHLKGVTHYTLQSKTCEKEYEQIVRTPFAVGRGFISRRLLFYTACFSAAASHRPTIFATGKTCFMEGTPLRHPFIMNHVMTFFLYDREYPLG